MTAGSSAGARGPRLRAPRHPDAEDGARGARRGAHRRGDRGGFAALREEYARRGGAIVLLEVAGGYQLGTREDLAPWIQKLDFYEHHRHLSRPTLETLAIIAYKQPVTRAEIEAIRGVNVERVVRNLIERKLVRILGHKDVPGQADGARHDAGVPRAVRHQQPGGPAAAQGVRGAAASDAGSTRSCRRGPSRAARRRPARRRRARASPPVRPGRGREPGRRAEGGGRGAADDADDEGDPSRPRSRRRTSRPEPAPGAGPPAARRRPSASRSSSPGPASLRGGRRRS